MRPFVALCVRRRVTVIMFALAVAMFGFVGYQRLALELFPDITYPSLTVQTDFPDTAPQEVEYLVTRPVEEAVGVLRGLQNIHSVSRPGVSEVTLEFDWGSDMDMLSMEVREKLDRLVLPEEAEDPIVLRFDPSLDPIVRLGLSGPATLVEIRRLAEKKIKPDFETILGVAAAQIKGGLEDEVQVNVDQERLAALGIPIDRIRQVVGVSNVNLPGGALRGEDSQFLIRTVAEFQSVEEIGALIIQQNESGIVRLRDVAVVQMGTKEREEISRLDGKECVELALFKEGDANTVTVSRLIRERIDEWQEKLPPGYSMTVLFDQSHFVRQAINEVRDSALVGGLLTVLVLFAFLREFRSTIIIATSIPLSVIATFLVMYQMGISLNIMSLGGLTLGIGMMVDNSIVVLEAIFRKRRSGHPPVTAVVGGTSEVAAAIAASTLTTVAVFLPIVFVEGIAGQLFRDQAVTVTISLLASLLVAITVVPMLSALGADVHKEKLGRAAIDTDLVMTLGRFSRGYDRFVRAAMRRRYATLAIAVVLFAATLVSVRWIGTELIPPLSEGEFFYEVNMPEGTSLAATDRVMGEMERAAAADPGVEYYYSTVGSRLVAGGLSLNTKAEYLGQLNIVMKDRSDQTAESATAEGLRRRFETIPDLEVKFGRPSYFSLKTPVEVVLYGDNLEDLRGYSLELARDMGAVPGIVDVHSSLEAGNPEIQVVFDRERLASLGLDMGVLSETLRNRVQGVVPTRFKEEDRQIDVRIRNQEANRESIADVRNLVLPGANGDPIRLLTVADVRLDRGPAEIHRLQQQRAAVISANLRDRSLGSAMRDIESAIGQAPPPAGITTELAGQNREMQKSFSSLWFAMALAIFLVYLVMAATFESFIHPFVVLLTIPLGVVGVAAGLLVTGTTITVMVLIGVILLAGIVVNNAIVLIDAVNQMRRQGVDKYEAVIRAGHLRLRPILMTTLTTVVGLIPMALGWGEGAELRAPLAITVGWGLFFGTLLTLVVIPAVYIAVPSRVAVEAEEEKELPAVERTEGAEA
jgi:HAE1 family hydrophobic/amphiphilic exporter-1